MTSSTPDPVELEVVAGKVRIPAGARAEVPGRGDLHVRTWGHLAHSVVELRVGERRVELVADDDGRAQWVASGLLGQVAGEVEVEVADQRVAFVVRPEKLVADAVVALVTELEEVAEGLALSPGAVSTLAGLRSRDRDLSMLDTAVGLAASAAPAIRRRPVHRAREVVRAVPNEAGARSARDVRWLATHPVQAARAEATGRAAGVVRERRADLDTLENRGVLSAYDHLERAVHALREVVDTETERLTATRSAREAFLTERGNLWVERDLPRFQALQRRRARLDDLMHEIVATRSRAGLPDLRPRGARMVRTPRIDAEPAYWATFRAFELAETAEAGEAPPAPAPVRTLDELWEQWCTVVTVRAVAEVLGPPDGKDLVDRGWFSTLRGGEVARWSSERRTVRVLYEPAISRTTEPRKLVPGYPWRPDLVVEVRWADGTLDAHVLDAKYRFDGWSALQEVWFKYGDSIGDVDGWPVVRSVWVLWPGKGVRLSGPRMLDPGWPLDRLRAGTIGLTVGRAGDELTDVLGALMAAGA